MTKIFKKAGSLMLALTMITSIGLSSVTQIVNAETDVDKEAEVIWRGTFDEKTAKFKISGLNGIGLCSYDSKAEPEEGTKGTLKKVTNQNVIKTLYYGLYKNDNNIPGNDALRMHRMISYWMHGEASLKDSSKEQLDKSEAWINVKGYLNQSMPPMGAGFTVWEFFPSGAASDKQSVVIYDATPVGSIQISKKSSDGSTDMSFLGIEYSIYNSDKTTLIKTISLKGNGTSNAVMLEPGKYYIKETKSNSHFKLDPSWKEVTIIAGNKEVISVIDDPAEGNLQLKKTCDNPASSDYSFDGIEYGIYSESKVLLQTVKIPANGVPSAIELDPGQYFVKELNSNNYYDIDQEYHSVTVEQGKTATLVLKDDLKEGKLKLIKHSTKDILDGVNFKGITYDVYKGSEKIKTLSISENGQSEEINIPAGVYKIKESATNKYYKLDTNLHTITIRPGETVSKDMFDEPEESTIKIKKILDGDAVVKDKFTFKLQDVNGNNHTETITTNAATDGNTYGISENKKIPAGTYMITEDVEKTNSAQKENEYVDITGNTIVTLLPGDDKTVTWKNTIVKDGSLTIQKKCLDGSSSSGFKFKITRKLSNEKSLSEADFLTEATPSVSFDENKYSIGEWKVSATDLADINKKAKVGEPGFYTVNITNKLKAKTSTVEDVNLSADIKVKLIKATETPGMKIEDTCTSNGFLIRYREVKFAGAATNYIDPNTGKDYIEVTTDDNKVTELKDLKYGEYTVTEIMSEKQLKKYHNEDGKSYIVNGISHKVETSQTLTMDKNNKSLVFTFNNIPKMTPVKLKKASVDDHISNISFSLKGTTDFGESISKIFKTNEKGEIDFGNLYAGEYVVEEIDFNSDTYINQYKLDGYDNPAIKFTISGNENKTVWLGGEKGIGDEGTTFKNVPIAEIKTTLVDQTTKGHSSYGTKDMNLVDTVKYKGLVPNEKYTITGTLVDKDSREAVKNDKGKDITTTLNFTPKESNGTVDVKFNFDGKILAGKTVVAYESLKLNDKEVAKHKDLNDKDQTIYIPSLKTTATSDVTKSHIAPSINKKTTINDKVEYFNLIPGHKYRVEGKLYIIKNGKIEEKVETEIPTGTKSFTAKKENGEVTVPIEFDNADYVGNDTVVYETLYEVFEDNETAGKTYEIAVGDHKDVNDKNQIVSFPSLKTTAAIKDSDDHIGLAKKDMTIVDRVMYSNLLQNEVYTVSGFLVDKETGKPLKDDNGKEIKETKVFTAKEENGYIDIEFNFDGESLSGKTAVVYETLKYKDKDIAKHEDINDENQTVMFPGLKTIATNPNTNKHTLSSEGVVSIIDKVSYKSLKPNEKYILTGTLINKETKQIVKDKNGKDIVSTIDFTPSEETGFASVKFNIDAKEMGSSSLVIYESLTLNGKEIAKHEDINDEDQSINIPSVKTIAMDNKTKEHISLSGGNVKITDTVKYSNLTVGEKYRLDGKLHIVDGDDGYEEKLPNSSVEFTAKTSKGEINVPFEFNGKEFEGKALVAFESLVSIPDKSDVTLEGTIVKEEIVAKHEDRKDKNQSINIPKIKTAAKETGKTGEGVITDTVHYEGLISGKMYTVVGVVMDKETTRAIASSTGTFIPEKSAGDVNVVFKDKALAGKNVVIFERVYIGENTKDENLVGIHADLNDKNQSVKVSKEEEPGNPIVPPVEPEPTPPTEPDKPEFPDQPEKPEPPAEPEKPSVPSEPEKLAKKETVIQSTQKDNKKEIPVVKETPKTGDRNTIYIISGIFIAAVIAGLIRNRCRRKEN